MRTSSTLSRVRPRLDPGIEVDPDELEELIAEEGLSKKRRPTPSLPRVAWLERVGPPVTARERWGRP